jgi:hypothetical protein
MIVPITRKIPTVNSPVTSRLLKGNILLTCRLPFSTCTGWKHDRTKAGRTRNPSQRHHCRKRQQKGNGSDTKAKAETKRGQVLACPFSIKALPVTGIAAEWLWLSVPLPGQSRSVLLTRICNRDSDTKSIVAVFPVICVNFPSCKQVKVLWPPLLISVSSLTI